MQEAAVFVIIELVSVKNPEGLKQYQEQASKLIGPLGGAVLAIGGKPVDSEPGFSPLVVQRWSSEAAFRAWTGSEIYQPLNQLRQASATMRVAIVPMLQPQTSTCG